MVTIFHPENRWCLFQTFALIVPLTDEDFPARNVASIKALSQRLLDTLYGDASRVQYP